MKRRLNPENVKEGEEEGRTGSRNQHKRFQRRRKAGKEAAGINTGVRTPVF